MNGNNARIALGSAALLALTQPSLATEIANVVFILDESGSVAGNPSLQSRQDVELALLGPDSIVPTDSSVALSTVLTNGSAAYLVSPMMVIASQQDLDDFVDDVINFDTSASTPVSTGCSRGPDSCTAPGSETSLVTALCLAGQELDLANATSLAQSVVIFSDWALVDGLSSVAEADVLRGRPIPVEICAVLPRTSDGPCEDGAGCGNAITLAKMHANTADSLQYDPLLVEGDFVCLAPDQDFGQLFIPCVCEEFDPTDSGTNGITDLCERDDNDNGTPDDVEIANDPGLDCNLDGILDLAQQQFPTDVLTHPALPAPLGPGNLFGSSIATDVNRVAIGSPSDWGYVDQSGSAIVSGAVYVFSQADADSPWTPLGQPVVPPAFPETGGSSSEFGFSVAVEGDRLIVGAPEYDGIGSGTANDGAVLFYEYDSPTDTWVLSQLIYPSNTLAREFGASVAMKGDRLIVGDPDQRVSGLNGAGQVSIFTYDNALSQWMLDAEVSVADSPDTLTAGDNLGQQVAIVGTSFVASAPRADSVVGGQMALNTGLVYAFADIGGGVYLSNSGLRGDASAGSGRTVEFGAALSGAGAYLAASSDRYVSTMFTDRSGRVHIFRIDESAPLPTFVPEVLLEAPDAENNDSFGESIALDDDPIAGTTLAIGSFRDNNPTGFNEGSVYLYRRAGQNQWDLEEKLFPQVIGSGSTEFGSAVGRSGNDTFAATGDTALQRVDVFSPITPCTVGCSVADIAQPLGELNFFDIAAYISAYNKNDPSADLAAPFGTLNFFDIVQYITLFNQGCP